ncbi:MAG: rod shape-determining protein RodA [Candidatus Saganbacteria bacterium]|nr:rod shape-determining protein RodA [Candidatus Saganbacteria bacterium]
MINFRLLRNSDMTLWICAAFLVLTGFLAIYSSTFAMMSRKAAIFTEANIDSLMFLKRHLATFFVALLFMSFFMYIDYAHLKTASSWLYAFMIVLLLTVLFVGFESYGAQRWIGAGPFSFQPSEISKLIIIIALAKYLESKKGLERLRDLFLPAVIVGVPFLMIFKQPDLGTALVLAAITVTMVVWTQDNPMILLLIFTPVISVFASLAWIWWLVYLVILAAALYLIRPKVIDFISIIAVNILTGLAVPVVWHLLKDYQKQRLFIFLNPSSDPFGAGYHTIQSQIAIGSGGFFGAGYLHGTQTQLQFIPQQWTDFIFSMIGEEFGLIGSLLVIIVFAVLIWRAITIAIEAGDMFGSLLAAGIAAMFAFHAAVNIGMTLGIAPVVGIPLPFISYGGTSLIVSLSAIGILQSISMRRVKLFF